MARSRKTTTTPANATNDFEAGKAVDILVPFGFVMQVDADLTVKEGEVPTTQRFKHAADTMMLRHEDEIKKVLAERFGARISFIECAEPYTGDPISGIQKKVRKEAPIPGTPAPAPAPAAPEPAGEDLTALSVKALRERCKEAGKKTNGNKDQLIARLVG